MVRRDVAGARVARATRWLDDAGRTFELPVDEFVAATKDRDLALFYLFLAIQECIDLAAHWVADAGWDPADDAASTFDVLADRAVITRDEAATLRHHRQPGRCPEPGRQPVPDLCANVGEHEPGHNQ